MRAVNREALTADRARDILVYDPETGELWWRYRAGKGGKRVSGRVGGLHSNGYVYVGIDNHRYFLHRVAWLIQFGEFPQGVLDHINGDRQDNRISNLRDVPSAVNLRNSKRSRSGGLTGAHWHKKTRKWQASIRVNKKSISLGYHNTAEAAHAAYMAKANEIYGGFLTSPLPGEGG